MSIYCYECGKEIGVNTCCISGSCGIDCYLSTYSELKVNGRIFLAPARPECLNAMWIFPAGSDYSIYPKTPCSLNAFDKNDFYGAKDTIDITSVQLKLLTKKEKENLLETIREYREKVDPVHLQKCILALKMK